MPDSLRRRGLIESPGERDVRACCELLQAVAVGPVAGDQQRHTGTAGGIDRRVESLLLHQATGHERVTPGVRAAAVGERGGRNEVRKHRRTADRHPERLEPS